MDLPFIIIEAMHFYGFDWDKIMKVRLKLFWTLVKNMHKIKAAENIRWAGVNSVGNMAEEDRKAFFKRNGDTLGQTYVSDERDEEGINKLKSLM